MKASIVSLYGQYNYGNRLQSYAVQEILRKMGFRTEVIYVQSNRLYKKIKLVRLIQRSYLYRLAGGDKRKALFSKREKSFIQFTKKNIVTKRYNSVEEIQDKDADIFVLGSDQVWNITTYNKIKTKLFSLSFSRPEKKICLSPSFGISEIPESWKPFFKEALLSFPKLSVREESGARIIKDLIGKDAEVLIDPTLMLNKEEWRAISKKPKFINTEKPYILTYCLGPKPQKLIQDCACYSEKLNSIVYHLQDYQFPELYTVGPSGFLYLFDHASLVLTDSYHACIFSFIFGRPFLLYEREGAGNNMLTRIDTFFSTFGLNRRRTDNEVLKDILSCDYKEGYNRLIVEKKKMIDYLHTSIPNRKIEESIQ